MMDLRWINLSRISDDYERMVKEFIEFAQHHGGSAKNRGNEVSLCQLFEWENIGCGRD